jgi:hypothetical protein
MTETTSPAYEIARYLESQGVGAFAADSGWSISVAQDGDVPDTTITLADGRGGGPNTDELDVQKSIIHVRVRGGRNAAYNAAYAKQTEIRGLLIEPAPLVTENMTFIGLTMVGLIARLGQDSHDRHILMATYEAERQLS